MKLLLAAFLLINSTAVGNTASPRPPSAKQRRAAPATPPATKGTSRVPAAFDFRTMPKLDGPSRDAY